MENKKPKIFQRAGKKILTEAIKKWLIKVKKFLFLIIPNFYS